MAIKIFRFVYSFWLVSAVVLSVQAKSVPAEAAWTKLETKNFALAGDATEREIALTAQKLERFRAAVARLFPQAAFGSPVPTRVVVFRDRKSFEAYKPLNKAAKDAADGFFQAGEETNFIALASGSDAAFERIFHDYAHYLLENAVGRSNLPAWLGEGIAEYYAAAALDERQATIGAPQENHLAVLRQNKLIAPEVFFNQDYYSLKSQTRETSALFQAQAWAIAHFLLSGDEKKEKLRSFVALLASGRFPKSAFAEAFEANYEAIETDLKKYLENGKFATFTLETGDAEIPTRGAAASEAEIKTLLGELLFRLDRRADAEKLLGEVLLKNPASSAALVTLGLIRAREGNFEEAKKSLAAAIRADAGNYLAHYGSALVSSREEMTGYGFVAGYTTAQAEKMRENLRRAIALNPHFAESYHLLAFVDFVRNEEIGDGLEAIEKALRIAPGNQWYQLRKAQLLMRRERFTEGRQLMFRIITTAPDDRLKVSAENALSVLNSLEAQLLSLKNAKYRKVDDGVITDEPVSEEELRRRREKAMIESLNLALRIPDASEKRILGYVTKIECRSDGVVVTVRDENRLLSLKAGSIGNLFLTAYDKDFVSTPIGCGDLKGEGFSVVTYRPANENAKDAGEVVAIEFVPKYFKFVVESK